MHSFAFAYEGVSKKGLDAPEITLTEWTTVQASLSVRKKLRLLEAQRPAAAQPGGACVRVPFNRRPSFDLTLSSKGSGSRWAE